jgi:hypothetical protein
MSTLAIILIVVFVVLGVLVVGGFIANARLRRAREEALRLHVARADAALAAAYAQDRGWERAGLEAAARDAWTARHPGEELRELQLVEVTDRPGTEEDIAVFRVVGASEPERLTLGRTGDHWQPVDVAER